MLKGRLGIDTARVPHVDRNGLLWVGRGRLYVEEGCLGFATTGGVYGLEPGNYRIPFQGISVLLLGPGTAVSHDALRLLARHGTALLAVGEDGVRFYASMPAGPDRSALARQQARAWADPSERIRVARAMYTIRMGNKLPPATDINALRGIEGARMKETYRVLAQQFGVEWHGRRYDRQRPEAADAPNQALNHAATAVEAAAMIATAAAGALPQLGFIHEDPGMSFCLDIADLHRASVVIPVAFEAVKLHQRQRHRTIEQVTRRLAGERLRTAKVIDTMIGQIKELFRDVGDDTGDHP